MFDTNIYLISLAFQWLSLFCDWTKWVLTRVIREGHQTACFSWTLGPCFSRVNVRCDSHIPVKCPWESVSQINADDNFRSSKEEIFPEKFKRVKNRHRLTEISRHLLNLNSSFQNYHMVLPQASPHHLKTPWKATEIISGLNMLPKDIMIFLWKCMTFTILKGQMAPPPTRIQFQANFGLQNSRSTSYLEGVLEWPILLRSVRPRYDRLSLLAARPSSQDPEASVVC